VSSTYAESFDRLFACLDEVAAPDPAYRTTLEKQDALIGWSRLIARAEAERMRVLAASDDVAEATGARSAAAWLADLTHDAPGTLKRHTQLGEVLDRRWTSVSAAFRSGTVNLPQTRAIVEALDKLPTDLGDDLLAKAETLLLSEAD
jgi:hypothetical protein